MRKHLLVSLAVSLLFLGNAYGQEKDEDQLCADLPGHTSGTLRFRRLGETFEIPIRGESAPASAVDCEPLTLDLHWANGRNNGSNFSVTFLDANKRPVFARQVSAFLSGVLQLPLSSFAGPTYGSSLGMISVPNTITIQAVAPFAAPAALSYRVTRVARASNRGDKKEAPEKGEAGEESRQGNEIVRIHNAVRLIGASRLPLVQIELKASRPFPVRDVPLQMQIGKRVFTDELSGDYTGRKLTLSLTPEMFAELKDGDEILAFFGKPDGKRTPDQDVWYFGKLSKADIQQ